jgi:RNA polymerase sigma factor (sigma-70 family)
VEVSALRHQPAAVLRGPTPLLRLQGDERLVALTRKGNQAAYEALVARYQARLLSFCRHMLSSREDAEDVLQEVFAAAFNAMVADDRPINVRPWLYRIARNRCLNHLRKQTAVGVDSMDVHFAENGATTADKVHEREEFRQLVGDVQTLPETQRTALLLREIDALSYEQIAEAMDTTVPSVKSLLVRARVSLAEAAEARKLTCEEVREELGEWAEGLRRVSPPVRRHLRSCDRCSGFKKQLAQTNRALAAMFPLGPLLLLKKFVLAQASAGGAAASASGAAATGATVATGATAGSALTAGVGALASKTAAGLAAAAIVTAGAVVVDHVQRHHVRAAPVAVAQAPAAAPPAAPVVVRSTPQPAPAPVRTRRERRTELKKAAVAAPATTTPAATPAPDATTTAPPTTPPPAEQSVPQEGHDNAVLPQQPPEQTATQPAPPPTTTTEQPAPPAEEPQPEPTSTTEQPAPPPSEDPAAEGSSPQPAS